MVHLHEMKQIARKKESHSRIARTQQTDKLWTWCKRFIFGRVKHLPIAFPTHSCSARHSNSMIQYVWGKKEQCGQELVQLLATELKHEGWERMNKNKYLFYSTYERAHNPLQTPLKNRFERRPQSSHGISLRLWNLRHSQNIAMVQKIKSWHHLQYSFVRGLKHLCYLFFGHVHVWFPKVPRCQAMPQNPGSNLIQAPHWQHGNGAKTCAALRSAQPRCPTLETTFVQVPLSSPINGTLPQCLWMSISDSLCPGIWDWERRCRGEHMTSLKPPAAFGAAMRTGVCDIPWMLRCIVKLEE